MSNAEVGGRALMFILGDQLFAPECMPAADSTAVFMAEDHGLCPNVRHHHQKLVLFLATTG